MSGTVGAVDNTGAGTKKVDTSEILVGANTVERQRVVLSDSTTAASLAGVNPLGELLVGMQPTQLFYDAFDYGILALNWQTPVASGTGAIAATSVADSGSTTLTGGTATNAYSYLQSVACFNPNDPGWIFQKFAINIENPVLTTGYRFWGFGLLPTSITPSYSVPIPSTSGPTISSPLYEAIGWEISTAGKLYAVGYATNVRQQIADLSSSGTSKQPTDALAHKYYLWYRGDYAFWAIDTTTNIVAIMATGAQGPNINILPLLVLVVSNSGTAETIVVNGVSVGDTTRGNMTISDASRPWLEAQVTPAGALAVDASIGGPIQGTDGNRQHPLSMDPFGNLEIDQSDITDLLRHIWDELTCIRIGMNHLTRYEVTPSKIARK